MMPGKTEGEGMLEAARLMIDKSMSEDDWAVIVEGMLRFGGWKFYHPYTGEKADTILDYICWRERTIWIELKKEGGKLSRDRIVKRRWIKGQVTVLAELEEAGAETYVWYPHDYEWAHRVLIENQPRAMVKQERDV
jgi:hypothetical protein